MSAMVMGWIVFMCVFSGALLGMFLRDRLPKHHLSPDSRDVVKLGTGLIGTMAALVIGLLISSAKGSFDTLRTEMTQSATNLVLLDRVLAHYGPEAREIREQLRDMSTSWVDLMWPADSSRALDLDVMKRAPAPVERIGDMIRELAPHTDSQRELQAQAQQLIGAMAQTRWLFLEQTDSQSIPLPFLAVLVVWLTVIFVSFGLFAPSNATVVTVLLLCALSTAGAIFLILEMEQPFAGLIKISSAPVRDAISHLGQ